MTQTQNLKSHFQVFIMLNRKLRITFCFCFCFCCFASIKVGNGISHFGHGNAYHEIKESICHMTHPTLFQFNLETPLHLDIFLDRKWISGICLLIPLCDPHGATSKIIHLAKIRLHVCWVEEESRKSSLFNAL